MKCYLCIDAGTTNLKAGLFDETGHLLGMSVETLRTIMPQAGHCEMDMNDLWESVCTVVTELRNNTGSSWDHIAAIGVSAQGEGAWLLDRDKKPVRNAILWNDTRSNTIDAELWNQAQALCCEKNLTPICPGSYLAILHWLKEKEPEHYHRTRYILYCKDWINFMLTGSLQTDFTDSSTTAFNIFTKSYEKQILDLLQLSEMKEALLKTYPSGELVAKTNASSEQLLGIPHGTPVAAGALDVVTVATGLGVNLPGQKGTVLGTSLGNVVVLSEDDAKKNSFTGGSVLCHVDNHTYLRQVSSLSGALVLEWCRKELANNCSYAEMEALAKAMPTGAEGLLFLPYLFGERAPFQAPGASASFFGLQIKHGSAHMVRAVYESLAYVVLDCFGHMPAGSAGIQVAGGASKSDLLCQMISDVTNEPVYRTRQKELGLFGMYQILSGNRCVNHQKERDRFTPDRASHETYMRQFSRFIELQRIMVKG